jgi:hypothetical protein
MILIRTRRPSSKMPCVALRIVRLKTDVSFSQHHNSPNSMPLSYFWALAFSYTIGIAAIIGLVRFKKILKSYRLFVVFACLALFSELISTVVIEVRHNNAIVANIYVLLEPLILLGLFYQWRAFNRTMFTVLVTALIGIWVCENLVFGKITHINSFYRLVYALVLVVVSIDQINVTMMHERKNLLRNSKFIICCLFTLYFAFRATCEVFYFVPMKLSTEFDQALFLIIIFVNLFVNLGYALAALWIPTKNKFTLPY